jgi:hypothetical protein
MVLDDPVCKRLTTDPTNRIEGQMAVLIRKSDIPAEVANRTVPRVSVPPRLYSLPKIHKTNVPLRTIVNCIASPTYSLAKHLAGLLGLLVGQSAHHIINSEAFIQKLHTINLQEVDILVSFDISLIVHQSSNGGHSTAVVRACSQPHYCSYQTGPHCYIFPSRWDILQPM